MYPSVRNTPDIGVASPGKRESLSIQIRRIPATVLILGFTSLFTDISAEMITAILPLYLTMQLGFTPFQFGLFDGIYQVMAGILRPVGGLLADRWRRYKEVAAAGYGLSALSKLGLLVSGVVWAPVVAALFADRLGKGIRTAPRDALISLSVPKSELATAFGVHRAMDTFGALLGPLVAFAILGLAPGAFDAVFMVSLLFAIIGLVIITLLAHNPDLLGQTAATVRSVRMTLRAALTLLREGRFRAIVAVGGILALLTVSDPFLYLVVQRNTDLPIRYFPLLFSGTAVIYLVLAIPVGRLADRIGRERIFLGGFVCLALVYLGLWSAPTQLAVVFVCVGLLGVYYAATDGVLIAMASAATDPAVRSSGIAILTTVLTLGHFLSSLAFGSLWSALGQRETLFGFMAGLLVAIGVAWFWLLRRDE